MDVGLGPMLLVLMVSMTAVRSQIREGPANALKSVGDDVTLKCVTSSNNCDQVEWQKVEGLQSPKLVYRNGIGMLNNDLYPTQRYSVDERGGCSLTITQLEIYDSGRFMCVQAVGDKEDTRTSILIVISVRESCESNVTSNVLAKDDGYSLRCTINIPPKSVEPSNVALLFLNKAVGETETTDEKQPLTVKTMLTGTAKEENITPRGCKASFSPNTEANYDNTTATLDICNTTELIVSSVRSQIRRGPANALKKVGDSVTLECVTVNKNCDKVDWQKAEGMQSPKLVYRNGNGMVNTNLYPPQRYSVNSSGICSLTITQLEISDSGRFICMHSLAAGEETRTSILVVINVTESCLSNVTSNALDKGDGYSFWCAIKLPPKSVEPSNVTLSFHNKTGCETATMDEKQPLTVKTMLTGTATKENITERGCIASFLPNTKANYDNDTAFLDVCATEQLIVSYPVENINVSAHCSCYIYKRETAHCTADGHPPPTFKWTHSKSGDFVDNDTLVIMGDAGDKYTCIATNTFKGRKVSKSKTIEVSSPPPLTRPTVQSEIREVPTNALKKVGDRVTLKCVTVNNNCDQVDWMKVEGLQSPTLVYRTGIGMFNNDLYPPQRYRVNESYGCSLTITQLEINDSGRFICVQAVGDREYYRISILVVINVTESCMSNVTSNALAKDDGYSLRCAINMPAKYLEPSTVTLSFHNKAVGETDTVNENQPLTVRTTLTGTATKENITHVCSASFLPNRRANYDNTTATLDVCTKQWIVSYPVENIAVSLPGPYYKGDTVRCTADGYPPPTFKWIHWKSRTIVDGDTLVIMGDAGYEYTCTATNTVKGRVASQSRTIEVSTKQKIEKGPANALKKVGDSVTLECVTVNKNCDKVDWQKAEGMQSPKLVYRNGNGMVNTNLYPPQRYSVNSSGICSLTITQLKISDSGRFICMHSLAAGEETRTSILVVINVTEPCMSNVTSNALDKDDGYSLRCAINIPPKSVWPSTVTLSFHNKTVGETETTDESQTLTVKTTLTGTATKENITQRVCRASFAPNTQVNYDSTTATLDICATQPLMVSYPVDTMTVSTATNTDPVETTTVSTPTETFKFESIRTGVSPSPIPPPPNSVENNSTSCPCNENEVCFCKPRRSKRDVVDDNTLVFTDDEGKTCTLKPKLKVKVDAQKVSTPLPSPTPEGVGPGGVAGAVCGTLIIGVVIGGVAYAGLKDERSPLYARLHSSKKKKKNDENGEMTDVPSKSSGPPTSNVTPSSEDA